MDIQEFARLFPEKMKELTDFINGDAIKDILGTEAIKHFQGSFDNEGFTDETLDPWQDVKRRDPNSPWYGHDGFESTKEERDARKEKNPDLIGKFSEERSTAKILSGKTRELRNGIYYDHTDLGVKIISPTPYGRVHQFGLLAKVYGKASFQMTPRPFMGQSVLLKNNIEDKIIREFTKIMKG